MEVVSLVYYWRRHHHQQEERRCWMCLDRVHLSYSLALAWREVGASVVVAQLRTVARRPVRQLLQRLVQQRRRLQTAQDEASASWLRVGAAFQEWATFGV